MYIQLKLIKTKSRSRDYYIMMLKLSKMYLHVFARLKCKIWEIQLRHFKSMFTTSPISTTEWPYSLGKNTLQYLHAAF